MTTIAEHMATDHRRCDEIFADAEALVAKLDWESGTARFKEFREAMAHHFSMEEEVLFPAFEECSGQTMGPTQVMRGEHAQMGQLLEDMSQALGGRDRESYLGLSETLMIIMQQHNMKEEKMLYPMADQLPGSDVEELLQKMEAM
jgi:iron-sulfur cluster repair protein YtfE (RIC family)